MKRTILALAIAGLSVAAYASPPPGGGPPTPIDVTVKNVPLPVTEQPSYVTPEQIFYNEGAGAGMGGGGSRGINLADGESDIVLQAYDIQAHVEDTATSKCIIESALYDRGDNPGGVLVKSLGRMVVLPGRDASLSVRLPNVYLAASSTVYLKVSDTASEGGYCYWDAQIRGVKVP